MKKQTNIGMLINFGISVPATFVTHATQGYKNVVCEKSSSFLPYMKSGQLNPLQCLSYFKKFLKVLDILYSVLYCFTLESLV